MKFTFAKGLILFLVVVFALLVVGFNFVAKEKIKERTTNTMIPYLPSNKIGNTSIKVNNLYNLKRVVNVKTDKLLFPDGASEIVLFSNLKKTDTFILTANSAQLGEIKLGKTSLVKHNNNIVSTTNIAYKTITDFSGGWIDVTGKIKNNQIMTIDDNNIVIKGGKGKLFASLSQSPTSEIPLLTDKSITINKVVLSPNGNDGVKAVATGVIN